MAKKLHVSGWALLPVTAAGAGVLWLLSGQVLAAFVIVGVGAGVIVADIVAHPEHLLRYALGAIVLVGLLKGPAGPIIDSGAGLPRAMNDVIGSEASKWWGEHAPTTGPPAPATTTTTAVGP